MIKGSLLGFLLLIFVGTLKAQTKEEDSLKSANYSIDINAGVFQEWNPGLFQTTPNHGEILGISTSYFFKGNWYGKFTLQLEKTYEDDLNKQYWYVFKHLSFGYLFDLKKVQVKTFLGLSATHRPSIYIVGRYLPDGTRSTELVEQPNPQEFGLFSGWDGLHFGTDITVPIRGRTGMGIRIIYLLAGAQRLDFGLLFEVKFDKKKSKRKGAYYY